MCTLCSGKVESECVHLTMGGLVPFNCSTSFWNLELIHGQRKVQYCLLHKGCIIFASFLQVLALRAGPLSALVIVIPFASFLTASSAFNMGVFSISCVGLGLRSSLVLNSLSCPPPSHFSSFLSASTPCLLVLTLGYSACNSHPSGCCVDSKLSF